MGQVNDYELARIAGHVVVGGISVSAECYGMKVLINSVPVVDTGLNPPVQSKF